MTLRFGVSRSHSNVALLDGVRRFASVLRDMLGTDIRPHVAADYDNLLKATTEDVIDFAWMPPFIAARAIGSGAVLAVVHERNGAVSYRSGLLVRADSPLGSLAELSRARAAWTDPQSAAGCILPRLHIRAHHPNPTLALASEQFYGSAASACSAVVSDEADLCASFVNESAANDLALAIKDVATVFTAAPWRLRILALTDSIVSDGIVIGAKVPKPLQSDLCEALLKLHTVPDGAAVLRQLMRSDRLVRATNAVDKSIASLRHRMGV